MFLRIKYASYTSYKYLSQVDYGQLHLGKKRFREFPEYKMAACQSEESSRWMSTTVTCHSEATWTAEEELKLLECLEDRGYGNWYVLDAILRVATLATEHQANNTHCTTLHR